MPFGQQHRDDLRDRLWLPLEQGIDLLHQIRQACGVSAAGRPFQRDPCGRPLHPGQFGLEREGPSGHDVERLLLH
jgi:hypothetical protein